MSRSLNCVEDKNSRIEALETTLSCRNAKIEVLEEKCAAQANENQKLSLENDVLRRSNIELEQLVEFYKLRIAENSTKTEHRAELSDAAVQTDFSEQLVIWHCENSAQINSAGMVTDWATKSDTDGPSKHKMCVADMVREAAAEAEMVGQLPGYDYDVTTGMYHNAETGYYYDPTYHPCPTAKEMAMHERTEEAYKAHFPCETYRELAKVYCIPLDGSIDTTAFEVLMELCSGVEHLLQFPVKDRKRKIADIRKAIATNKPMPCWFSLVPRQNEEGSSSVNTPKSENEDDMLMLAEMSLYSVSESVPSESTDDDINFLYESSSANYPPCIRVIVKKSDCLQVGVLCHVATHMQRTILGSDSCVDIPIDSDSVSPKQCQISYDLQKAAYFLDPLSLDNATYLNNQLVTERTQLGHDFVLTLGETELLLHIHSGHNTCLRCEPGIQMNSLRCDKNVKPLTAAEKERVRVSQLRSLKKKYGLQNAAFESQTNNPNYVDRAKRRRIIKGSDDPYAKEVNDSPSSVHTHIPAENKGFKMLSKMGWKSGQSIGKDNTGILEPIAPAVQLGRTGLGALPTAGLSALEPESVVLAKKKELLLKTLARFENAPTKNSNLDY